ncbi:MAG: hypothetical protein HKO93_05735 [Flavobacteriales bacterium]|nr:hypothetical protein [Flavobacteriales bacterium]
MKKAKFIFGLALGAMVALAACEKEVPLPYGSGLADQSKIEVADLDKQLGPPARLGIRRLVVTDYPKFNTKGEFWDDYPIDNINKYPDIFVVIDNYTWKSPVVLDLKHDYKLNAIHRYDHTWLFPETVEIPMPMALHRIVLYDFDDNAKSYQKMGEAYFTPFTGVNGYPENIYVRVKDMAFMINLEYSWEQPDLAGYHSTDYIRNDR